MRIKSIVLSGLAVLGVCCAVPVLATSLVEYALICMLIIIVVLALASFLLPSPLNGPSDVIHFKAPVAVVAHLSSADEKFKGTDLADFLGDFYAVSHKEVNGVRSFTFTQKGVGSIDVSCALDGKCTAKKAAELKAL